MNKLYKPIDNFEKLYEISEDGDVKSLRTGKNIKTHVSKDGYVRICLRDENKKVYMLYLHKLIMDTFIKRDKITCKMIVCHKDGDKQNNSLNNLIYMSYSDMCKINHENNENLNKSKRICKMVDNGVIICSYLSIKEAMVACSIKSNSNIINACKAHKKYKGYYWKYLDNTENNETLNNGEIFKKIDKIDEKNYDNYEISNYGNVKNTKTNNIYSLSNNTLYYKVSLYTRDKKRITHKIHRLVALFFVDNPNNYDIVNHIDENKKNNHYTNLEWCDNKENVTHSCGKKVSQIDIKSNKVIKVHNSIKDAEKYIDVGSHGNIQRCCNGKLKKAYGFKWSFV